MQRCDHGHPQFAQKCQNVTTGGSAENAEFVLQAHDVYVADIEEVGRTDVGRKVLLLNLEAHFFRILIATLEIVDRYGEALALRMSDCDGGQ
jgi:hypothetical protein